MNAQQASSSERDMQQPPCDGGEHCREWEDQGDVDDLIFLNEPIKRHSER